MGSTASMGPTEGEEVGEEYGGQELEEQGDEIYYQEIAVLQAREKSYRVQKAANEVAEQAERAAEASSKAAKEAKAKAEAALAALRRSSRALSPTQTNHPAEDGHATKNGALT
eukprot:gb/GEZN01027872.1/.p1 GENE.gb/GEZN01027872.1/~~gb/GEZN01027872.1/.p1  ORF type:complete len:113 (-),score=29.80 gb/GEZN01027872.1/:63-401(-)